MSWESFYLGCFLVGFLLSVISFLGGSHVHLGKHVHVHSGHGHGDGSPINFATLTAFLTWFGGAGYLLTRYSSLWALAALGLAALTGLGGAATVFWFLLKFLLKHDFELDPADYDMIGVLGRISGTVRAGGTGEMIYSQAGARHAASVRSETGDAIPKGAEVIVTRYEKGIAYVRPWDELTETNAASKTER